MWTGSAALVVLTALGWVIAQLTVEETPRITGWQLYYAHAAAWALFAVGAWLLLRLPRRPAVLLIVLGAAALQVVALSGEPQRTDDFLRYAWDGRVQAAGIDPYRYAPDDPALTPLHDEWLFPTDSFCADNGRPPGCPRLNRPSVPTIYPPVAQLAFVGIHALSPDGTRHKPLQIAFALAAVATALVIVAVLRRVGGDPRYAVLWAWCPTVILDAGNGAHLDVLMALLVAAGLGALALGRYAWGGTLLGAAIGVKLLPALVFPAALRRRPLLVAGSALAVLVVTYLPHVLAVGPRVIGYLPGYLEEEGYDGSLRFLLVQVLVPEALAPAVGVVVLGVAALICYLGADPNRPWDAAVVLTGVALLVVTPHYPWYATILVVLVALSGRWEWLAVALAGYPAYFGPDISTTFALLAPWTYAAALTFVLAVTALRRLAAGRGASHLSRVAPAAAAGVE